MLQKFSLLKYFYHVPVVLCTDTETGLPHHGKKDIKTPGHLARGFAAFIPAIYIETHAADNSAPRTAYTAVSELVVPYISKKSPELCQNS